MPVETQVIDIPFGGLETKVDPKIVQPGQSLVLENAEFIRPGELSKRAGFSVLRAAQGATTPARSVGSFRGRLIAIADGTSAAGYGQTNLYQYASENGQWKSSGQAPAAQANVHEIGLGAAAASAFSTTIGNPEIAIANNFACYFFTYGANLVATVVDLATGGEVLSGATVFATTSKPRAIVIGNNVYVAYNAGNSIRASYIDTSAATIAVTSIGALYTDSFAASSVDLAIQPSTGDVICAYKSTVPDVRLFTFNTTGIVIAAVVQAVAASSTTIGVGINSAKVLVFYLDAATDNIRVVVSSAVDLTVSTAAATVVNLPTAARFCYAASSVNTDGFLYYDATTTTQEIVYRVFMSSGGAGATPYVLMSAAQIASKPIFSNGRFYIALQTSAGKSTVSPPLQGQYLLCEHNTGVNSPAPSISAIPVASFLPGRTRDPLASPTRHHSTLVSYSNSLYFAGLRQQVQQLLLTEATVFGVPVGLEADISFEPRQVQANDNLLLAEGIVREFDGDAVVESNFYMFPDGITLAQVAAGSLADGVYQVSAVYAWFDAKGALQRGVPSVPVTITVAAGGGTAKINVVVTNLRPGAHTNALILVYCTDVNGSTFYESAYAANDPTTLTQTIAVGSVSATGRELYTTGDILENEQPPPASSAVAAQGRVFLFCQDGQIWYSKQFVEGECVAFSSFLTMIPSPDGGTAFELSEMDGNIIVLGENSIQVVSGSGPTDAGSANGFSEPRVIASDVGNLAGSPVVKTDLGVFFKSRKGIMLLDRSLSVSYIGAPVEAYNANTMTAATLLAKRSQVIFGHSNGPMLVYEYGMQKGWSVWKSDSTYLAEYVKSACVWDGEYVYCSGSPHAFFSGAVLKRSDGIFDYSSTPSIGMVVETPWIKLSGLQGFQRIRNASLLGEWRSDHTLTMKIYYDYNPAIAETVTFAATNAAQGYSVGDPLQMKHHLGKKCEAVKLRFEDSAQSGTKESARWTGVALEVGVLKGVYRQPTNRTV